MSGHLNEVKLLRGAQGLSEVSDAYPVLQEAHFTLIGQFKAEKIAHMPQLPQAPWTAAG